MVQRLISNIQKVKSWGKWLSSFFLEEGTKLKITTAINPNFNKFYIYDYRMIVENAKFPLFLIRKTNWVKNFKLWKTLTCKNMSRVWKSCFFNSSDFQWIRNAAHTYKWKWENPLTWRERTEKRLVLYTQLNFHLVS